MAMCALNGVKGMKLNMKKLCGEELDSSLFSLKEGVI